MVAPASSAAWSPSQATGRGRPAGSRRVSQRAHGSACDRIAIDARTVSQKPTSTTASGDATHQQRDRHGDGVDRPACAGRARGPTDRRRRPASPARPTRRRRPRRRRARARRARRAARGRGARPSPADDGQDDRREHGDVAARDRQHVVGAGALQPRLDVGRQAGAVADQHGEDDRRRLRIVRARSPPRRCAGPRRAPPPSPRPAATRGRAPPPAPRSSPRRRRGSRATPAAPPDRACRSCDTAAAAAAWRSRARRRPARQAWRAAGASMPPIVRRTPPAIGTQRPPRSTRPASSVQADAELGAARHRRAGRLRRRPDRRRRAPPDPAPAPPAPPGCRGRRRPARRERRPRPPARRPPAPSPARPSPARPNRRSPSAAPAIAGDQADRDQRDTDRHRLQPPRDAGRGAGHAGRRPANTAMGHGVVGRPHTSATGQVRGPPRARATQSRGVDSRPIPAQIQPTCAARKGDRPLGLAARTAGIVYTAPLASALGGHACVHRRSVSSSPWPARRWRVSTGPGDGTDPRLAGRRN